MVVGESDGVGIEFAENGWRFVFRTDTYFGRSFINTKKEYEM